MWLSKLCLNKLFKSLFWNIPFIFQDLSVGVSKEVVIYAVLQLWEKRDSEFRKIKAYQYTVTRTIYKHT